MRHLASLSALIATACFSAEAYLGEGPRGTAAAGAGGAVASGVTAGASTAGSTFLGVGGNTGSGAPEGAGPLGGDEAPSGAGAPPESDGSTLPGLLSYPATDIVGIAGVEVDPDTGDWIVMGSLSGQADLDPGPGVIPETGDNWLLPFVSRVNPNTGAIWVRTYDGGGSTFRIGDPVSIGQNGIIVFAGGLTGTLDFDPGAGRDLRTAVHGSDAGFITELSSGGDEIWTRTLHGIDSLAAAAAPNGHVVAVGSFAKQVDLDPGDGIDLRTPAASDVFMLDLGPDGALTSPALTFGGPGYDDVVTLRVSPSGTRYLMGPYSAGADLDPTDGEYQAAVDPDDEDQAAYVTSIYPDGTLSWIHTYQHVALIDLAVNTDHSFLLGSYSVGADLDPGAGENIQTKLPPGQQPYFLSMFDNAGKVLWTRTWADTCVEPRIAAFEDGSVTFVANYGPDGGIDGIALPPVRNYSLAQALYAFAADGSTRSVRAFGYEPGNWVNLGAVAAAPDGTLLVAGTAVGTFPVLDLGVLTTSGSTGFVAHTTPH